MDFTFDVMSAAEHERLTALYGPLTEAVRELIEATIRTGADEGVIGDARTAIEAVTKSLRGRQLDESAGARRVLDGRPLVWGNAVVGLRNPLAPPLTIQHADGRYRSDFSLGVAYEGPPGLVHGGVCALILDQMLGEAASEGLTKPLFTGTITVKYLRGTPLGVLRAEAFVERTEGIKTVARGHLADAAGVTAEAEGVFVTPAWARAT